MVIGILTHYSVNNQGAQLQMHAMKYWLENLGHRVIILTYEKNFDFDSLEEKKNSGSVSNFSYYLKNYLLHKGLGLTAFNTLKVLTHKRTFQKFDTMPYNTDAIDCVIIGSDEVFSIDVGCNQMMYGYGLKAPAIAYAPAFGRSTEELLKEYNCYELIQDGLSNIFRLSARDTHTQSMIRNMTGREVPLVCDPVFLYDGRAFHVSVEPIHKKYMIVYSYDRNMTETSEIEAVKTYAKKHNLITVSLGTYHKWCDKNIVCNAEEWYSYFADAECVLTDTFHGSVVAMKNHCKAAFFIRESINAFKMESLLQVTGLTSQRLSALTAEELEEKLSQWIDYDEVDQRIANIAEASGKYLKDSLDIVKAEIDKKYQAIRNITVPSEHVCSGCSACITICPNSAIQLQMDTDGFYKAFVEEDKCVHCGLCKKVCTRYDDILEGKNLHDTKLYALQSSNADIVRSCSSGGIAHVLAEEAIKNRWKVVGAVYNTETNRVEHQITDQLERIRVFDGSKYLQSNTEKAFVQALKEACENPKERFVVFGTPCQIGGMAKNCDLAHVRDQFLLVEIFCHGVPSYKLWEEEIDRISKKLGTDHFDEVLFRYKKDDWHSYCLRVSSGERIFYGKRENELFWQVFFENILLGDSCYRCRMRKEISMADLRLGDYWGRRYQHRSDGVSAVFAVTERGNNALQTLIKEKKVIQMESGGIDEMLAAQNMGGYHQQNLHDQAMSILKSEDVMKAIKNYRKSMSVRQKGKRIILSVSAVVPDKIRAKLRKANSSRKLS